MDKSVIYYGSRVFFAQLLYGLFFGIASAVVTLVLSFIISLITGSKESVIPIFSLCVVVLTYCCIKLSLKKMLFKPYKKFVITTEIEKITPKMVFTFWGMKILVSFPIVCLLHFLSRFLADGKEIDMNAITYSMFWLGLGILFGFVISFCIDLIVSRYFISKYAFVTSKQSVKQ